MLGTASSHSWSLLSPTTTAALFTSPKMDTDSVTELLAEAAELVQMFEYQEAVQKFYEAHQLEPENTTVLDQLAEVLLEIGQVDDAQHISIKQHRAQLLVSPFHSPLHLNHSNFPTTCASFGLFNTAYTLFGT